MAMWEMSVAEVKDQTWEQVVVSPLMYQWTGPQAETLRQIERRIIAIGDAWQHEDHVKALQLLLQQRGLDQLALVDGREPWYKRLWAQLWGLAEA